MGRRTEKKEFVDPGVGTEIRARFTMSETITLTQDEKFIEFSIQDVDDMIDLIRAVDPSHVEKSQ